MALSRAAFVVSAATLALGACAAANPDNLPGFFALEQQIQSYYEAAAWEGNASCLTPRMLGVTRATVVRETADQITLDVSYAWRDKNYGGGGGGAGAGDCSGFSERQFVVARREGRGYSIVSMSGAQRG